MINQRYAYIPIHFWCIVRRMQLRMQVCPNPHDYTYIECALDSEHRIETRWAAPELLAQVA